MSYQVLARKWRPRRFAELKGQAHVVTALTHALEGGRLHHAYLLTGTRGVGKTTIARLLAKSLNCVKGVTATPCGECAACVDIDAGRFVDLLELDAASHTGVDNMREILDNARYAPTVGRYKVYLIDEVHMLSKGAFNSMLKTLEEPPEHVKFVLATTEAQKIPVTVLSRCLQFNLKPLPPTDITEQLAHVLSAESVPSEPAALALIARAARGSMRDALSLVDQAIAFGGGAVREAELRSMLGAVDRDHVYRIVDALLAADGAALLAEAEGVVERGLSAVSALDELASLFHRIAVVQAVPSVADVHEDQRALDYAKRIPAEGVQLAYQIVTQGRADLALAPDEATGLSMTLLRLLAFEPAEASASGSDRGSSPREVSATRAARPGPQATVEARPAPRTDAAARPRLVVEVPKSVPPHQAGGRIEAEPQALSKDPAADARPLPERPEDWRAFVSGLRLGGMAAQIAAQTELRSVAGAVVNLALPASHKHLADRAYSDKLKVALEQATGRRLILAFEVGEATPSSLAATERRARDERLERAQNDFRDEPFVRDLVDRFDGTVRTESIKPLSPDPSSPA